MMKKFLNLFIAVFFICNFILNNFVYAVEENEIIAQSAILMDKVTGRVLWEKNSDEKRAMASTTKIMTCIIALESGMLDKEITVSHKAEIAPKVKLYIKEGESYVLEDLLYALMLESSNDVAVCIAEGIGGSVEAFCDKMTQKAKEIGAINTSFKTPNGLDSDGHYTTAYDLALITKYALDNPEFLKIINTPSFTFSEKKTNKSLSVDNKNAFLNMYKGANGVKTGYTGQAGYCFVGSVKQDEMELIVVVLASGWPNHKTYRWKDTISLMNYGFNHYEYKDILKNKTIVTKIEDIKYAKKNVVEGVLASDLRAILREDEKVDVIYNIKPIKEAPILKGSVIGEVFIYIDNEVYTQIDILATHTVERIDYQYCCEYVWQKFLSN